jgi:tetratricopeptide (TPR) repeat protein
MKASEMNRWSYARVGLLTLGCVGCGWLIPAVGAQASSDGGSGPQLQQRYDAAQKYQATNDLEHAAEQYRLFLSDAVGEIAVGWARAGDYEKAANDFDEVLRLNPDSTAMRIAYARSAVESGKLEHARLLAMSVLRIEPVDAKASAEAHAILGRVLMKSGKNAEAKQEFEEAVALDSTFEHGYELAVADLDTGDGKGAAKIFAEMLASFGDTAEIHMRFGQAYLNSDFQGDAVGEFEKAVKKDDRVPGLHYSLAAAYLATVGSAKLPEAEAELRKEIAISPKDAPAYAALGHLLAGQQHDAEGVAEAEGFLKRAMELNAKNPDGFFYMGQFDADLKKSVEAEALLRKSIALTTDVSRNGYQVQKAHYLLGRLLMETGETDEGKREIAASQVLMQQNLKRDQSRLSDYLEEQKSEQAGPQTSSAPAAKGGDAEVGGEVEAFEKQLGPAIADSYNNLGAIAGGEGKEREALQSFEKAGEWNPALPGLDYNWGRAAFAAGAVAEAVGPLSRYSAAHPDDEGARAVLGLSLFIVKDYAGVRKTLQPLDGKSGEAPQLQYAYAASLVRTGDTSGGVARLLVLEKANPNAAEVHRMLGEAYVSTKSVGAAEELGEAIRLNPADAEARVDLARLQLAKGDANGAVGNLEAAVKLQPNDAALQQELAEARTKASGH